MAQPLAGGAHRFRGSLHPRVEEVEEGRYKKRGGRAEVVGKGGKENEGGRGRARGVKKERKERKKQRKKCRLRECVCLFTSVRVRGSKRR